MVENKVISRFPDLPPNHHHSLQKFINCSPFKSSTTCDVHFCTETGGPCPTSSFTLQPNQTARAHWQSNSKCSMDSSKSPQAGHILETPHLLLTKFSFVARLLVQALHQKFLTLWGTSSFQITGQRFLLGTKEEEEMYLVVLQRRAKDFQC